MKKRTLAIILVLAMLLTFMCSLASCLEIQLPEKEDDEDEHTRSKNKKYETILTVMPDGEDFEQLDVASLGISEKITEVYKETSGKGYVFRVTSEGYKPGMVILVGIDADGKITGTKCLETLDIFAKEPELDGSYNGQSLEDFTPNMISGATMTSTGYRDAVNTALRGFVLVSGSTIDPVFTIVDLLPTLAPGFVNPAEVDTFGNMKKAYKASNDAGFAYIFSKGDNAFFALVNATGGCAVYDAEAKDVTSEHTDLAEAAKSHAAQNQKSYASELQNKISKLFGNASNFNDIEISTFGTIVSAMSFKAGGAEYYGFYSRSVGFDQMDVYVIIDAKGAIAKIDAEEFIFSEKDFIEYLHFAGLNTVQYTEGFKGLTSDTWGSGDAAVIAGATKSSDAIKTSVNDAFDAYKTIK